MTERAIARFVMCESAEVKAPQHVGPRGALHVSTSGISEGGTMRNGKTSSAGRCMRPSCGECNNLARTQDTPAISQTKLGGVGMGILGVAPQELSAPRPCRTMSCCGPAICGDPSGPPPEDICRGFRPASRV